MFYSFIPVLIVFIILMMLDKRPRTTENHLSLIGDNFNFSIVISLTGGLTLMSFGFSLVTILSLFAITFGALSIEVFSFQALLIAFGFVSWIFGLKWASNTYELIKEYKENNIPISNKNIKLK